jgi:hypothetical protein
VGGGGVDPRKKCQSRLDHFETGDPLGSRSILRWLLDDCVIQKPHGLKLTLENPLYKLTRLSVMRLPMSPENQIRLEILQSAPLNSWIALSEDESRIVATGSDYDEVVRRADETGEEDVVILKTPPFWAQFSV